MNIEFIMTKKEEIEWWSNHYKYLREKFEYIKTFNDLRQKKKWIKELLDYIDWIEDILEKRGINVY